ncbi:imidazolonepropionase-like amidohydrolase [Terracoccus luteus]|uniref:Imidazolonepropionase-like amidohydrolase n=1 Tax=Terracoccus luteus TaxID=53356 RepID=A0A495Y3J0_9MICO|nr:amidohydrolase family protein [Terracoccus luteus]RKT79836.1 imidazolonepropionase-like amidohydrolase [Terracoccus luteus]
MCLHDHDAVDAKPTSAMTRRGVLGAASVLAGVTAVGVAGVAGAGSAAAAETDATAARYPGRPTTVAPLVIEGGSLVDPLTGHVVEDAVVVLRGGKVLAAGTRAATRHAVAAVGPGARRIDVTGRFVLPGLVDVHVHANALADAKALLSAGATSVRSGSSSFYQDVAMRSLPTWAPGLAPRMRAAGMFVSPLLGDSVLADPDLAPLAALPTGIQSKQDLRYLVKVNLSRGVDVIKTRANPRAGLPEQDPTELVYDKEQLSAVVNAAAGRPVLCHAYSEVGIDGAVRAGVKSIEHGVFVGDATIDRMQGLGTNFTPTMSAIVGLLESPDPVLAARGREYVPVLKAAVKEAHDRGVTVVAGTDSFGTDVDPIGKEIRLLTEAGLSPLDGLRAATTSAARLLGWEQQVGRLRPGSLGDVVVTSRDPLADGGACEALDLVVAQGVVVRDDL